MKVQWQVRPCTGGIIGCGIPRWPCDSRKQITQRARANKKMFAQIMFVPRAAAISGICIQIWIAPGSDSGTLIEKGCAIIRNSRFTAKSLYKTYLHHTTHLNVYIKHVYKYHCQNWFSFVIISNYGPGSEEKLKMYKYFNYKIYMTMTRLKTKN